jgi:hypothetical protein
MLVSEIARKPSTEAEKNLVVFFGYFVLWVSREKNLGAVLQTFSN